MGIYYINSTYMKCHDISAGVTGVTPAQLRSKPLCDIQDRMR